jgi:iron complex outermembrane receptor protein
MGPWTLDEAVMSMGLVRGGACAAWMLGVWLSPALAQAAGTLQVKVTDAQGAALVGATVVVTELGREAQSLEDGGCRFDNVPAGRYHVSARLGGFAAARDEVRLEAGADASLTLALGQQVHFSESVTVSPNGRDTFEAYQPTTVLGAEDLQQRLAGSLGDTLGHQVGVNVRSFGPGPARPVIRGLDGDRVLVLENGARTGDLSSQSADHGVTLDPASATQIEVVRGPATLLYGSNALGGVVNLVNEEIPTRPLRGVHGAFATQGGSANDEAGLAARMSVGNGTWALQVNGSARRAGDAETPAGSVPNSQNRTRAAGAALARTGQDGFVGVAYQYVDTLYGVPFVEEGETTLNPRRHRLDVRAERRNLSGFFTGMKFQGGYRNYRHDEIEGDGTIATAFSNKFAEAELLLNHRAVGRLTGTFGAWATQRDYSSVGEEALAPPTKQRALAGFLYEELNFRHVSLQAGARVEHARFDVDAAALPERDNLRDRSFTSVSASLGLLGHLREDLTVALSVARAARNPSLEELYNFGPHAGNFAFEVGNPELTSEVGLGLDASLRYRRPRFAAEATYFRNAIDNFIFAFQTGEIEDGLPVVDFVAADAVLQGFELHADAGLTPNLWLEVGADAVRGARSGVADGALPRIPPLRAWTGLRFQKGGFHLEGELRGARRQERLYGVETPTAGYAIVNLHGAYTWTTGRSVHTATLRLDNAGDRLYRNHLSYIKDAVPELGRAVKLVYAVRF